MAAWVLSLLDDTSLVYNSISTYVWGMRTMHTLQHQSDPAMGVEFFREFMRSISVLSAVPGEPRKRVELEVVSALLHEIMTSHVMVTCHELMIFHVMVTCNRIMTLIFNRTPLVLTLVYNGIPLERALKR